MTRVGNINTVMTDIIPMEFDYEESKNETSRQATGKKASVEISHTD